MASQDDPPPIDNIAPVAARVLKHVSEVNFRKPAIDHALKDVRTEF